MSMVLMQSFLAQSQPCLQTILSQSRLGLPSNEKLMVPEHKLRFHMSADDLNAK